MPKISGTSTFPEFTPMDQERGLAMFIGGRSPEYIAKKLALPLSTVSSMFDNMASDLSAFAHAATTPNSPCGDCGDCAKCAEELDEPFQDDDRLLFDMSISYDPLEKEHRIRLVIGQDMLPAAESAFRQLTTLLARHLSV